MSHEDLVRYVEHLASYLEGEGVNVFDVLQEQKEKIESLEREYKENLKELEDKIKNLDSLVDSLYRTVY